MHDQKEQPEGKSVMVIMLFIIIIFLVAMFKVTYSIGYQNGSNANDTHYAIPGSSY